MEEPLRVAAPSYYGLRAESNVGGERYERLLLRRLPAHGIALRLGLPADSPFCGAGPEEPVRGWRVDCLRHDATLHWTAAPRVFVPYVRALLRAGAVDLLRGGSVRHAGPSLLLARTLVARRERVPVVLHHHHLFPRWARLEAAICARADAVITVSDRSRRELVGAGVPAARVHVIRQGVERPPATAGDIGAWPTPPGRQGLRLLVLGRLEARKRPELAVDTVAELVRRSVPATLVIAGAGTGAELSAVRDRIAAAGVGDRVALLGPVGDAHKWRLYDGADVLLFGSTLEGFGLVIAEAQSRGVPVIAAAGAATAEAVDPGESALLLDADPRAFADGVARLAADRDLRARMSARATEFAARFDADAAAAAVADLYRSVARAPGR